SADQAACAARAGLVQVGRSNDGALIDDLDFSLASTQGGDGRFVEEIDAVALLEGANNDPELGIGQNATQRCHGRRIDYSGRTWLEEGIADAGSKQLIGA